MSKEIIRTHHNVYRRLEPSERARLKAFIVVVNGIAVGDGGGHEEHGEQVTQSVSE